MNQSEVIDILTLAQAYDKRTLGEVDAVAWLDIANRGRWTFDEAAEAVRDYYAFSIAERPFIMPSHITNAIRARRQDEAMRRQTEELKPGNPDRARELKQAIAEIANAKAIPGEPRPLRNKALGVKCPHCNAEPLEGCTRPSIGGRRIPMRPHPSRVDLAYPPEMQDT